MDAVLLQYGILGAVVVGLSSYILKIEARHRKERKEWQEIASNQFKRMNDLGDETNQVIREHTNILSGLKTLLENRRTR